MTTKQAINLITRISYSQHDAEKQEALSMAVRALSSQQTDTDSQGLVNDCISRQAAIDAVSKWFYDVFGIKESDGTATIFKRLRELPSAQPQPKNGKWINHRNDDGHNIADCDQCGNAIQWFDGDEIPRYCCMCGADMRGESDD